MRTLRRVVRKVRTIGETPRVAHIPDILEKPLRRHFSSFRTERRNTGITVFYTF